MPARYTTGARQPNRSNRFQQAPIAQTKSCLIIRRPARETGQGVLLRAADNYYNDLASLCSSLGYTLAWEGTADQLPSPDSLECTNVDLWLVHGSDQANILSSAPEGAKAIEIPFRREKAWELTLDDVKHIEFRILSEERIVKGTMSKQLMTERVLRGLIRKIIKENMASSADVTSHKDYNAAKNAWARVPGPGYEAEWDEVYIENDKLCAKLPGDDGEGVENYCFDGRMWTFDRSKR